MTADTRAGVGFSGPVRRYPEVNLGQIYRSILTSRRSAFIFPRRINIILRLTCEKYTVFQRRLDIWCTKRSASICPISLLVSRGFYWLPFRCTRRSTIRRDTRRWFSNVMSNASQGSFSPGMASFSYVPTVSVGFSKSLHTIPRLLLVSFAFRRLLRYVRCRDARRPETIKGIRRIIHVKFQIYGVAACQQYAFQHPKAFLSLI